MATVYRSGIVAGIETMLEDYRAAHGDDLRSVWRARPESFGIADLPAAFVERPVLEGGHLDMQTHERVLTAAFVVIDRLTGNEQASDELDALVDALVSHMCQPVYIHLVPNTHWTRYSVTDGFEDGFVFARISLDDLTEVTGRSS
jgi:hypothetical protein